jgi:hypothetical protein
MSRNEYLKGLSEDFGIPYQTVKLIADLLGENEDHDALINYLEDYKQTLFDRN